MVFPSKLLIFGNILSFIQPHVPETPTEELEFIPDFIEKVSEYSSLGYEFAIASNMDEIIFFHQSDGDGLKKIEILMSKIQSDTEVDIRIAALLCDRSGNVIYTVGGNRLLSGTFTSSNHALKPNSDLIQQAISEFERSPQKCIVITSSDKDAEAASCANILSTGQKC